MNARPAKTPVAAPSDWRNSSALVRAELPSAFCPFLSGSLEAIRIRPEQRQRSLYTKCGCGARIGLSRASRDGLWFSETRSERPGLGIAGLPVQQTQTDTSVESGDRVPWGSDH